MEIQKEFIERHRYFNDKAHFKLIMKNELQLVRWIKITETIFKCV